MIHVRPYIPDDRTFVLSLAPRLLIGMPPWRDPQLWLTAFQNWLTVSIDQHGQATMVFVALPRFRMRPTLRANTTPTSTNSRPATWPKDAELAQR